MAAGFIQVEKIPESDIRVMANTLLMELQEFFKNPENQKEFEEWKEETERGT